MARGQIPLSPVDAAALNSAFQALQRGDAGAALAAARGVLKRAPKAPAALHLQALCLRNKGDIAGATQSFEQALAEAPRDADILNNYGSFLRRKGDAQQAIARYRAALTASPARPDIWINLSQAQMELRDYKGARASAQRALALNPNNARALLALASALREIGDLDGAETALRTSLKLDPTSGPTWTALGVVRRVIGDPTESLACYARARALGYASPELADAEASAHLDLGETEKALAAARALTQAAPDYVAGHVLLAHVLWEYEGADADNDPLGPIAHAVAAQPSHAPLRRAFVNLLLDTKRAAEALEHIHVLRATRDDGALVATHAAALEQLGQLEAASDVFAKAMPRVGAPQGMGVAYAQHLIRVGRADEAVRYAMMDAERDPEDQQAWSTLSTAWRLTDDPREHWLCDYERFVMSIDVAPPEGFADRSAFIAALTQTLTAMHTAQHAPVNQSLRGGTQTSGGLFGRKDPVIAGAREALRASVCALIADLPSDPRHPFLRRNTRAIRFTGSWSVRLRSSGRHVNHYHPQGWLSSAFYVELPPSVANADAGQSGWIQFGQPPADLGLDLAPRRVVQPEVGRLVLFPSYMWHGTVPFTDDAPRLTMAFDAVPA